MNDSTDQKQGKLIALAIIVGSVIIGGFIYFGLNYQVQPKNSDQDVVDIKVPTPDLSNNTESKKPLLPDETEKENITQEQEPTLPKESASQTDSTEETKSDQELIEESLLEKTSIDEAEMKFEISENTGQIARGVVKEKNAISGAMWMAAKEDGKWTVTYVGQGVPECDEVNPYNYPLSWTDYCVDENGNTVHR